MLARRTFLLTALLMAATATVALHGCSPAPDPWAGKGGPPRVVVTFAPLACFVRNVAGEHAGVITLCKEQGPHDYTYNATDGLAVRKADLFLANGLGLDDAFADKVVNNSGNARLRHCKLGDKLDGKDLITIKGEEKDPHVWLGMAEARRVVELIRDELTAVDEAHKADYARNAERYLKELRELEKYGTDLVREAADDKLISFHDSLQYFARSFGLEIVGVIEEGPGVEPSGPQMKALVALCEGKNEKGEDVKWKTKRRPIAVEPQYPQTTAAEVLKREVEKKKLEVVLVKIDPLETAADEDLDDAGWYVKKMRENLDNLAKALKK
jgi:ABC-type Zn uptake system ZnuABC Zn-binding protein ZnuA